MVRNDSAQVQALTDELPGDTYDMQSLPSACLDTKMSLLMTAATATAVTANDLMIMMP